MEDFCLNLLQFSQYILRVFFLKANDNCSLCHFDGCDTSDGLESMINSLKEFRQIQNTESQYNFELSLYICGGFNDNRNTSIDLTNELFGKKILCFVFETLLSKFY
jgi:hypothetical protein